MSKFKDTWEENNAFEVVDEIIADFESFLCLLGKSTNYADKQKMNYLEVYKDNLQSYVDIIYEDVSDGIKELLGVE